MKDLVYLSPQLVSFFGILSLVYAAKQTQRLSETIQSTASQQIMSQQQELYKILVEDPKLYPYFFESADVTRTENEDLYLKVRATADVKLDFFDLFWDQASYFPDLQRDTPSWRSWEAYIGDSFRLSPMLCRRFDEVQLWYDCRIVDLAERYCPAGTIQLKCDLRSWTNAK